MTDSEHSEGLAYHAARLLILVRECGTPRKGAPPGIRGRTLLAKLDFFVRYPEYLQRASDLLGKQAELYDMGVNTTAELRSVESRMVRYRYGPWDHTYYGVLGYLIGKSLLDVGLLQRSEVFRLTTPGVTAAEQLAVDPRFADVVARAKQTRRLFAGWSGSRVKDFIYEHFPEVVSLSLGKEIF